MDLVEFLRARLDEDAELARSGETWTAFDESPSAETRRVDVDHSFERVVACTRSWRALHIAAHDPARVLLEVDAKRRLLARGGPVCTSNCDEPGNEPSNPDTNWTTPLEHHFDCAAYEAAQLLALPYADHLDYREEWRP
ncbi:DUF6221 family protein [Streptomyces sp. NPDC004539]|uniref:DUF6221 family protein n=1 Tax=Streptomyces sp. NPDC004539 TaxID=3154280 RepID=UPI0033B51823